MTILDTNSAAFGEAFADSGPRIVCVLGMHRSGTSLITRILDLLGVYLGPDDRMIGPIANDNPKGFWEHTLITALNEEILAKLGGSWHEPAHPPPGWEASDEFAPLRQRAREIIAADFGGRQMWGWKDPRTCLTLPFWRKILPPLQHVICVRNPLEIARSLEKRNAFPWEKSLDLWFRYLTAALEHSVGQPRYFIAYEDIMRGAPDALAGLCRFLGRTALAAEDETTKAIKEFIDAELQHHRSSIVDAIDLPALPLAAKSLYFAVRLFVRLLAQGQVTASYDSRELMESLELLAANAAGTQRDTDAQRAERAELQKRIAEYECVLQDLRRELDGRQQAIRGLEGEVAEHRAHREATAKDAAGTIAELNRVAAEAKEEFARRAAEYEETIAGLKASAAAREAEWAGSDAQREQRWQREQDRLQAAIAELSETARQQAESLQRIGERLERRLDDLADDCRTSHASIATRLDEVPRKREEAAQKSSPHHNAVVPRLRYQELIGEIRQIVERAVPRDATVIVVSKGDDELLKLGGRKAWHFPCTESGVYAGHYPADSAAAIGQLEVLLGQGGDTLLIPATAAWWLEHYQEFARHLENRFEKVWDDERCIVFRLAEPKSEQGPVSRLISRLASGWFGLRTSRAASSSESAGVGSTADGRHVNSPRSYSPRPQTERPPALFDAEWYLRQSPDVRAAGVDPWLHYQHTGAREGRSPHPLFDAAWYLQQNPDVAEAGVSPLEHYILRGAREGLDPHPLFDGKFYWRSYPESVLRCLNPLEHYLSEGWRAGNKPNAKFDPRFYLAAYPDVAAAGMEPLTHFVQAGFKEGKSGCAEDAAREPHVDEIEIPRKPIPVEPPRNCDVKAIAFYLPQFHRIPENDAWWGEGFTEWANVRRGAAQFAGHYQPHVPADLGYYDLRDDCVMERQADLARRCGIHGFCLYYYWFAGKVLLDLPLRRILESGKPDFPFCICWANENWTRCWDGLDRDVLIAQQHSAEDDLAFIRRIEPILLHRSYIRVEDKPFLAVYRPSLFPDTKATTDRWRDYFRRRGHGRLFLAAVQSFHDRTPPEDYGFDGGIQFPPHVKSRGFASPVMNKDDAFAGRLYDYVETKRACLNEVSRLGAARTMYPGVMPSWDNTARRRARASVWMNSSPESYFDWLAQAAGFLRQNRAPEHRLVFINAWNEWAEGCHLEPDERFGHAWLNATRLALEGTPAPKRSHPPAATVGKKANVRTLRQAAPRSVLFVSHDAHPHGAQYALLTLATWLKEESLVAPRFLLAGPGRLAEEFAAIGPVLRMDDLRRAKAGEPARVLAVLRSFCRDDVSAVYLNSAASGRVSALTTHLEVPHIAHVHELEEGIRRWVGAENMAQLAGNVKHFIAASAPVAANLHSNHAIPPEKISVIEEYIKCSRLSRVASEDKDRCKTALGFSADARVVLGCGTTDWRKGPDLFVEVAERTLRAGVPPIEFVWVGGQTQKGEIEQLEQLVQSKGLAERVKFVGPVAMPLPYMLAADVFVLPSREDPFPLVCLEAADCGLPILCFAEAGGMPDFVRVDAGVVVPYLDVDRMAAELKSFLNDAARQRACGNAVRQRVRQSFDVSVKGRAIYDVIESVCCRRSVD